MLLAIASIFLVLWLLGVILSPSFLWDDSSLAYRSNRDVRSSSVQEKSTDVNRCEIEWQGYSLKGTLFH